MMRLFTLIFVFEIGEDLIEVMERQSLEDIFLSVDISSDMA